MSDRVTVHCSRDELKVLELLRDQVNCDLEVRKRDGVVQSVRKVTMHIDEFRAGRLQEAAEAGS